MCGIAGIVDGTLGPEELQRRVGGMTACLRHRGPDDGGVWVDGDSGVALGFRRLAILDLSAAGHQPMFSPDGRYVAVFNGEIYNFRELRAELEALGATFRGGSDTEVLVAACARWGVERAIPRCWGMFACAVWDRDERRLVLARDRLGKKPLYYGRVGGAFCFASELKSVLDAGARRPDVDRDVLALYLRKGYVPAPHCIVRGMHKLPAGHMAVLAADGAARLVPYWTVARAASDGLASRSGPSPDEALSELDELLRDSVGRRMIADVPLGVFLSGGVDSSLVAALMQVQSDRPVRSFSIGFHEQEHDEARDARRVAQHLGTEHRELYVTPRDALDVIQRLPSVYDEPFADSSQIPTLLLAGFTRRHVTVALSGDGGDELFYGYHRYRRAEAAWRRLRRVPSGLGRMVGETVRRRPAERWDASARAVARAVGRPAPAAVGERLHGLADAFGADGSEGLYRYLTSLWKSPEAVVLGAREAEAARLPRELAGDRLSLAEQMMYLDTVEYLPDDILVKVDRASMAESLEVRSPLLDHRLVEWAWRLPPELRHAAPQPKALLRRLLHRYVPAALVDRPKQGFAIPLGAWLRGPLRDWAEALLDADRLLADGFLDPAPVRRAWEAHLAGTRDDEYALWTVLMFQCWLDRWGHA